MMKVSDEEAREIAKFSVGVACWEAGGPMLQLQVVAGVHGILLAMQLMGYRIEAPSKASEVVS